MGKKLVLGTILVHLGQIRAVIFFFFFFFFLKIWLRRSLDIMISQKTQKKKLYITDQLRDDYPNP